MKKKDVTQFLGLRFGRLVVESGTTGPYGGTWVRCQCDCGEMTTVLLRNLKTGRTKSCGCYRREFRVILPQEHGTKIGGVTLIRIAEPGQDRIRKCLCACGDEFVALERHVLSGNTRSCGCLQKMAAAETGYANRIHGLTNTPTYDSWGQMVNRCTNPRTPAFKYYGGRGISICSFLRESVENLISVLGERPIELSLDRIDNERGYSCGSCEDCTRNGWTLNVRWATDKQQSRNRRGIIKLTIGTVTKPLTEWGRRVPHKTGHTSVQA